MSLSRFFSVSRPLTLLPEAVVTSWSLGIGILMGRPAFLWRIDSSNNDFNCTSDSLDFECSSLKEKCKNKKKIKKDLNFSMCILKKGSTIGIKLFSWANARKLQGILLDFKNPTSFSGWKKGNQYSLFTSMLEQIEDPVQL